MMNPAELLPEIKGRVPNSLYEEIEYQAELYEKGKDNKPVIDALFRDAIDFLKQQRNSSMVRKEKTESGVVYRIREEREEYDEPVFGLLSEPTSEGFLESYHDVVTEVDVYKPTNPMEKKGRLTAPVFLDSYPDFLSDDNYKVLGVDVADTGSDSSVITARAGIHVIDIQGYEEIDTNQVTGRVMDAINEHKPDEVVLDCTGGWGNAVYRALELLDIEELLILTGVKFNQKPRDDKFNVLNARSEMYFLLQERFRLGLITIPKHKKLIEELAWTRYRPNPTTGRFEILPKEQFRKDNKRSPDFSDSLCLAFYNSSGLEVY